MTTQQKDLTSEESLRLLTLAVLTFIAVYNPFKHKESPRADSSLSGGQ